MDFSNYISIQISFHNFSPSDGIYHVTVRALNNIEYGGPMAASVCHSTEYIIDTTPPIIHAVENVTYDETDYTIGVILEARSEAYWH